MKWMHRLLAGLLALVLLSACSTTSNVPLSSPLKQPPAVETLPGSIAILYAENLRHHRCIAGKGYIAASWTIELGPPSIGMFDRIFSALFENPVRLQADAASQIPANSKGVIEVSLLNFDGCEAQVACRWLRRSRSSIRQPCGQGMVQSLRDGKAMAVQGRQTIWKATRKRFHLARSRPATSGP